MPYQAKDGSKNFSGRGDIWIVDDGSNLARNLMLKLQEKGQSAKLISLATSDRQPLPERLQGLFLLAPMKFDHIPLRWLQSAFRLIRRIGPQLLQQEDKGFVVTVSRHGGHFGLDGLNQLSQVYAGAVSAFSKTIAHEWDGVHVRALDLGRDFHDGFEAAIRCLDAAFINGPLEIGVSKDRYFSLRLEEENRERRDPEKALDARDTVLVTGGARGVTAASLLSLAKRYPVRFVIWGRSAYDPQIDPELQGIDDAATLKRMLLTKRPELKHPRDLEKAYKDLLAQRELHQNFEQLKKLGAQVVYEEVDVSRDGDLRAGFARLKAEYGAIAGVIHGAGVIRDHLLVDQKDDELAIVLETKLRILPYLESLAQNGTRWMVFFSSSTARLGRKGQGAYALANEVLNRMAAYLPQLGCRAISLNWGPWDGGMVHDGLKQLFASEGLDTIPLQAGADLQTYLLEEPALGSGEWLVLGSGGREILGDRIVHREEILKRWSIRLDNVPVLLDHVIKQKAVVPAALLLEWMSSALHAQRPDYVLQSLRGFQVWKGITLDLDDALNLEVAIASEKILNPDSMEVELVLRGWDQRPHAHVYAQLGLEKNPENEVLPSLSIDTSFDSLNPYDDILFHGDDLQLIKKVLFCDRSRFSARIEAAGEARAWSHDLPGEWLTHAPLIDVIFQGMIVWAALERKSRCLPARFQSLKLHRPFETGLCHLEIQIREAAEHRLSADAKIWSESGELILSAEGLEATMDASLAESFRQREIQRAPRAVSMNV